MASLNLKDIQIKPATQKQGADAAPLIYATDPALWNYIFNNDHRAALDFFSTQFKLEDSPFRYSLCTAAINGKKLMGIELGRDYSTSMKIQADSQIMDRFKYLLYLIPPIPKGVYYITFLSTVPDARNIGLGGKLLLNAFERAHKAGYKSCQLDVFSDNRAVVFYQHHGMQILSESRVLPLEKFGVHSHYRMEKVL
ncbi:MAG: GNAT family N-acetyltransferase [Desulfobacterales bacterium]|nr:GNAT family N-acetyltransferase [Desulfobacterales bacterium]